jgi:hypothetical protein
MDAEHSSTTHEPPVAAELRVLVQQAQDGDARALPRIREILDTYPVIAAHLGDLAALVERAWIAVLAADNPLTIEAMKRTIQGMRQDLAGEHPTPLEKLLVGQVIVCWLEVQCLQGAAAEPGRGSLEQASFRLKRLESAQRRFDGSVKTLTTLRSLLPAGLAPANGIRLYDPDQQRQQA